ncbi:MAG: hypothetical protein COU10_02155 [Candidatus Harrisonbacteria bacterium CG10_big_fil_rev_8_21_14_0_10_45_28]|uniref:Uncharacterized protein n=1 Tax=Candidatus Harrisonbacteria bacterium CG10_big_fil_rev_8_21_14_0_10_45_28 TaxID=1974586 RepID=A0A2H0UNA1_9BACT|nr:MAG: hypothetical protein COU10_02155 [Candidatus Harrisonbacteria bacterium CG10_big_fil_rev_8_21_14_0_10_45_28]
MKKVFWFLVIILVLVLLIMFFSRSNDTQINGDVTDDGEVAVVEGEAMVLSVEIFILESMPIQIKAVVRGDFADGCTEMGEISQSFENNVFIVKMLTVRERDAMCTEALVPFSETITLENTVGLKAGEYSVLVNGVEDKFTLDADNTPAKGSAL